MLSPAQRHRQRVAAAQEGAAVASGVTANRTQYELMLLQLAQHRRQLKEIQSVERKIEAKRIRLPEYDAYLDGVLEADAGGPDEVLTTLMVWHIDCGLLDRALNLGEYALAHGLEMPPQYNRDLATTLAEEVAEKVMASKEMAALMPAAARALDLTTGLDMPDEVKAKQHKALGQSLALINKAGAIEHLSRALELNPQAGVKKEIERLQRELKKEPPPPE